MDLKLDKRGFLPAGIHQADRKTIHKIFCYNYHRLNLWDNFLEFIVNVLQQPTIYPGIDVNTPLILSGSFFSDKNHPNDIDCVFILNNVSDVNKWYWSANYSDYRDTLKAKYNVDFNIELPNGNNFASFFSYIKPEQAIAKNIDPSLPRGIVRFAHE